MKQLICGLVFVAVTAAQTQTRYVITDLGANNVAAGLNARGDVVGTVAVGGVIQAARWSGGVRTDLGVAGGSQSYGNGINASGQVTGYTVLSAGSTRAIRWAATGTTYETLPPVPGACCSYGNSINSSGQVAGTSYLPTGPIHAVRWTGTVLTDLGTIGGIGSDGRGINDSGDVAGDSSGPLSSGSARHAVRWTGTTPADLGTLPGGTNSYGFAINASGQVAGYSEISNISSAPTHAVRWTGNIPTDLGVLFTTPPGGRSQGFGIDTAGRVVGASNGRAFLWDGTTMLNLNDLLVDGDGWLLTEARGINDNGQIVANGTRNSIPHAALLTPVATFDLTFLSSPPGRTVHLNGIPAVTPLTRFYLLNSSLPLFVLSPQDSPDGTRYLFRDWSDGGAQGHTINVQGPATYTANFTTQYFLTTQVSPPGSGSVTPASGYYDPGIVGPFQANPVGCYGFLNWTGAPLVNGAINLDSPKTLQANFVLNQRLVSIPSPRWDTLRTVPARYRRTVSATSILPYTADVSFILDPFDTSAATLLAPVAPTGQTTACSTASGNGAVGRNYYTVRNVPPYGTTSVSFDFSAPVAFTVSVVAGPGPR